MTNKHKRSLCAVLLAVAHLLSAHQVTGAALQAVSAPTVQSKPSGVMANAALAAASAADAASAAANAANAAAKAAQSVLEALNALMPQRNGSVSDQQTGTQKADPTVPVTGVGVLPLEPQKIVPQESLGGSDSATAAPVKFYVPSEHSLVALAGRIEVPVFVDQGGEFRKNVSGGLLSDEQARNQGETNLHETVQAGRSFSRETLAADARTEQARAQTGQAFALLLPSAYLRASTGYEISSPSVRLDPSDPTKTVDRDGHNRKDLSFTISQPLFDLPSYLEWRRRNQLEKAKIEGKRATDGDAFLATTSAYLSLVSSRIQADMTRDFEAQLKNLLVYIEKRSAAGVASISDLARVKARNQSAISSRLEYESAHAAAGIEFVRLTNMVPNVVRIPELEHVGGAQVPSTLDQAVTVAMVYNPEVTALNAEISGADIDKTQAKSRFLPKVSLEYTDNWSQHAGGDVKESGQRDQRMMFVLNWSLFSGGGDYRYYQERLSRHTELKYRMDDQRRRTVQGLSANYATLANTRERLNTGYQELASISIAAEAMSKRMLAGNQSLLDLLDVYDRYYQARMRLVNLHVQEMGTVAQIVRLTKGVPEKEVKALTDSLVQPPQKTPQAEEKTTIHPSPAVPEPSKQGAEVAAPKAEASLSTGAESQAVAPPEVNAQPEPLKQQTGQLSEQSAVVPKAMATETGINASSAPQAGAPESTPAPVVVPAVAGPTTTGSVESSSPSFNNPRLVKTWEKAVKGDIAAQRKLGWVYSSGMGEPQNKTEAIRWYKKASEQGDIDSQLALGWIYYTGNGVEKNLDESRKYYQRASEKGSKKAQEILDKINKLAANEYKIQ